MMIFRQSPYAIKAVFASFVVASALMFETLVAETRYRVRSSDNVNTIIERYYPNSNLSRGQLLIGILIRNPRAFKGGNVNFLLRGKRLTLPEDLEFARISPDKASALLSEHARFYRIGVPGNLPIPTLSDMEISPDSLTNTTDILMNQKSQTEQIAQLQQESKELRRQLDVLFREKAERDKRLRDLEIHLKQSPNVQKNLLQSGESLVSADPLLSEKNNTQLRIGQSSVEANMAEMSKVKVGAIQSGKQSIESDDNVFSGYLLGVLKSAWSFSLVLLGIILFYFFRRSKRAQQVDDVIRVNEAGYIESLDEHVTELQGNNGSDNTDETTLETSVKLDVARAYIEAEDTQSALDILTEIMEKGCDEQKQQAQALLANIST